MINEIAQKQIDYISSRCKEIKPHVVIRCITYNHEPYIKEALDGFVMQKTNFPFIAIVHDDASKDGTTEILKEYAEKYPDIIFPIFEEENQYSKKDGSLRKIINEATLCTDAKYVALCEGDDYWTDPNKLQKQVDFLESHPDYSMCFHNAMVKYELFEKKEHIFFNIEDREYSEKEHLYNWIAPTASICFRTIIQKCDYYNKYLYSKKLLVGDYPMMMVYLRNGKTYGMSDIMSVYRKQSEGWTNKKIYIPKLIQQELEMAHIFGGEVWNATKYNIAILSRHVFSLIKHRHFKEAFETMVLSLKYAPVSTMKENFKFMKSLLLK